MLCLIHPSVPSTFLAQIANPKDPNVGWMAAMASTTLAHRTVPEGEKRAFPHFFRMLSCRLDPPKTRRCMLVAYDTSHVNRSWTAGISTPDADSTASLIDLTCPFTTSTELGHLQRMFLAPHPQSRPTSLPKAMTKWKAHCRTETPLCGVQKCPNL